MKFHFLWEITREGKPPQHWAELRCVADGNIGQCFYNGLNCIHKEINPEVKEKVKHILKIELKIAFVLTEPFGGKIENTGEETIPWMLHSGSHPKTYFICYHEILQ